MGGTYERQTKNDARGTMNEEQWRMNKRKKRLDGLRFIVYRISSLRFIVFIALAFSLTLVEWSK